MIIDKDIAVSINVHPSKLSGDIDTEIRNKVDSLLLKREIDKLGLVLEINDIKDVSGGKIEFNTCLSKFNVVCNVKVYQLEINEIINSKVKELTSHGYFLEEPIEIFVGVENKPVVKVGDSVKSKITKLKFSNGKYIVIAKQEK